MTFKIISQDIFKSENTESILHVVNYMGYAKKGFVVPLRKKYPQWYTPYKEHCDNNSNDWRTLKGSCHYNQMNDDVFIIDCFAMPQLRSFNHYEFANCLDFVSRISLDHEIKSVSVPRGIGSGLARGSQHVVETLLEDWSKSTGINVTLFEI